MATEAASIGSGVPVGEPRQPLVHQWAAPLRFFQRHDADLALANAQLGAGQENLRFGLGSGAFQQAHLAPTMGWIQLRLWHTETNLPPGTPNALNKRNPSGFLQRGFAGWTGLEPAASGVTGRRYNQLNYHPMLKRWWSTFRAARIYPHGRRVSTSCFVVGSRIDGA